MSTLISEDLACVTAGILISQGKIGFIPGVAACMAGILGGDLMLFAFGRLLGRPILRWKWVARYMPESKVAQAAAWLEAKGLRVVLLSRFTPGLRLPTYFAAGMLRVDVVRFSLALLVASLLWTPLLVGASANAGTRLILGDASRVHWVPVIVVSLFLPLRLLRSIFNYDSRRRLVGAIRRILQWEFWPIWAVYLPLLPYLLFLAIRHRSLTVFTAANPGIVSGGLAGESKAEILRQLAKCPGAVPDFMLLPGRLSPEDRIALAARFMRDRGLTYPVVLKPDIGERGEGVAIIRSEQSLAEYLHAAKGATILQRYVAGPEFGVFYYRYPGEDRGTIYSITEKLFPSVVGDGVRSVHQLVLADERAVCMMRTYAHLCSTPMTKIPAVGEDVPLAEIGSHCRGTVFLDATSLRTPALEQAIDTIARAHQGFHIGRFDIRAASRHEFCAGHSFSIIELNGVGGEATHIYDPRVSIVDAYRSLGTQWRIAFEIGEINRRRGAVPFTVRELASVVSMKA
ncbi:MAG: VTT domain-containing protein [Bryobacteraceae bacterium]